MQCEVELLDNIDPAMYCLELSGKKKSLILIVTLSTVAVITLISKEILKCLKKISLFRRET